MTAIFHLCFPCLITDNYFLSSLWTIRYRLPSLIYCLWERRYELNKVSLVSVTTDNMYTVSLMPIDHMLETIDKRVFDIIQTLGLLLFFSPFFSSGFCSFLDKCVIFVCMSVGACACLCTCVCKHSVWYI